MLRMSTDILDDNDETIGNSVSLKLFDIIKNVKSYICNLKHFIDIKKDMKCHLFLLIKTLLHDLWGLKVRDTIAGEATLSKLVVLYSEIPLLRSPKIKTSYLLKTLFAKFKFSFLHLIHPVYL